MAQFGGRDTFKLCALFFLFSFLIFFCFALFSLLILQSFARISSIEMNSILYDILKLKKASKFKKHFDQHCYAACFETFFPVINQSGYKPPWPVMKETDAYFCNFKTCD